MTGLLGSTVLEVAIGLAFVYLLLAIFCTTVNEWIAGALNTRSKMLQQALAKMLAGQPQAGTGSQTGSLLASFYGHPLIQSSMRDNAHPSYLAARSFAKALMDLVTPQSPGRMELAQLESGIKSLPDGDVKRTLLALIQNTSTLEDAQKAIEGWFDDTMDRVSGWYKRRTQVWTVVVAAIVTIGLNADTVHVARKLWTEPTLRSSVVEEARNRSEKPRPTVSVEYPDPDSPANPQVTNDEGNSISDPEAALMGQMLGWQNAGLEWGALDWLERVIGWILTIIAVSLGAPFWFDSLNKFMNLRSAGKSPDEKAKTPQKAKQPPDNRAA